ncbi:MAG: hypothetical protein JOY83_19640 [Alphaproteobacteria bacterium]|nr:hypothetical protein [Alphaproteobacteria bacterium]
MTGLRCHQWARFGCITRPLRYALSLTLPLILSLGSAQGHDPSAWGGLFRSRDDGATWMSANRGQLLSGVTALAVSPADPNHLLLGTETGLFRSRNGGRDWSIEAPSVVLGSVFAAAFAADGQRALISTGFGIFRRTDENGWQLAAAPRGAAPARAIVPSPVGGFYFIGATGLYRSDDQGASWSSGGDGLPEEPATVLLGIRSTPETLCAIVQGHLWASADGGRNWTRRGTGTPLSKIETLAADLQQPALLWAASADRVFRSNDAGASWQPIGPALPEPNTIVHGIAASDKAIVLTTDRGLYRMTDGSANWTPIIDNLPAHLEAGPLVRDPIDPATLYAGFSLIPYNELWRRAGERESALARVSAVSIAGSAVLLVLIVFAAVAALRWFGRYYDSNGSGARSTREIMIQRKKLP